MSVLMKRLETLTWFENKLKGFDAEIMKMRGNPTTTVGDLGDLMKKADSTAKDFNEWMTKEFKFSDGPQIMPTILKTVLEQTLEPSRIITP